MVTFSLGCYLNTTDSKSKQLSRLFGNQSQVLPSAPEDYSTTLINIESAFLVLYVCSLSSDFPHFNWALLLFAQEILQPEGRKGEGMQFSQSCPLVECFLPCYKRKSTWPSDKNKDASPQVFPPFVHSAPAVNSRQNQQGRNFFWDGGKIHTGGGREGW